MADIILHCDILGSGGISMRQKTLRSLSVRIGSGVVASALLMVFFQNCGKAGFDTTTQSSVNLSSSTKLTGAPYAFDASFDQITYNSCANTNLAGQNAYFTLKAGAYQSAGVILTTAYREYVKNQSVIKTENGALPTIDQIKVHLSNNIENTDSRPQIAMRSRSSIQEIRSPSGVAPAEGVDYFTVLGNLTDDRWMDPLVRYTGWNYFFNLAPENQRALEMSLTYNTNEGLAQGLRNDLANYGMIALTFRDHPENGGSTRARVPTGATDSRVAYGRGYLPLFEAVIAPYTTSIHSGAATAPHSLNPNNILTRISEIDLKNPSQSSGGTWTCDPNRRYVVVQPSDQKVYCPRDPFAAMLNSSYRAEYEIVRRHLKPEEWDVSVYYRCAVPKVGSCYITQMANGSAPLIEYDQAQPCYQAVAGIPYNGNTPSKLCAQYISICNRN